MTNVAAVPSAPTPVATPGVALAAPTASVTVSTTDGFGSLLNQAIALLADGPGPVPQAEGTDSPIVLTGPASADDAAPGATAPGTRGRAGRTSRRSATAAIPADATAVVLRSDPAIASAAGMAAPTMVVSSLSALQPEFKEPLQQVVDQLEREGYAVCVRETARTQERQDALYAQGRSRPGPVVTWTRSSRHTDGCAADLTISGGPGGYARMHELAGAAGLRTLGARDPGHVELRLPALGRSPVFAGAAADSLAVQVPADVHATTEVPVDPPRGAGANAPAGIPAAPLQSDVPTTILKSPTVIDASDTRVNQLDALHPEVQVDRSAVAATPLVVPDAAARSDAHPDAQRDAGNDSRGDRRRPGRRMVTDASTRPTGPAATDTRTTLPTARIQPPAIGGAVTPSGTDAWQLPVAGATMAARIGQLDTIAHARAAQPVSQMVLHVPAADGGTDRVRVSVRGTAVDTDIAARDAGHAERLAADTGNLRAALAERGLTTDAIRVRHAAPAEAAAPSRAVTPPPDGISAATRTATQASPAHGTIFAKEGRVAASPSGDAPMQEYDDERQRRDDPGSDHPSRHRRQR